jgi:hypothetical protein
VLHCFGKESSANRKRVVTNVASRQYIGTVQVHPRIGMLAPWLSAPLTTIIDG